MPTTPMPWTWTTTTHHQARILLHRLLQSGNMPPRRSSPGTNLAMLHPLRARPFKPIVSSRALSAPRQPRPRPCLRPLLPSHTHVHTRNRSNLWEVVVCTSNRILVRICSLQLDSVWPSRSPLLHQRPLLSRLFLSSHRR
jgi:hypothetical protein